MSSPTIDIIPNLCYTWVMFNGTRIKGISHRKLIYLDTIKSKILGGKYYSKHDEHKVIIDWGCLSCFYHKYLIIAYCKGIYWIIKEYYKSIWK